jgi:DNA-binding IclR family transcriptional regulator
MPSSVDKSSRCLEVLAATPAGLTVTELALQAQLSRPAATRLLQALAATGMVTRDVASQRYRLGLRLYELGAAFVQQSLPITIARREMLSLTEELGRSFHFLAPDGPDVVVIESSELVAGLASSRPRPSRRPWFESTSGRVFAAFLPAAEQELLQKAAPVPDRERLDAQVAATRQRGFALQESSLHPGEWSVAVPIYDRTGNAVAALATILQAGDLAPEIERPLIARMLQSAARVSEDLGFHSSSVGF